MSLFEQLPLFRSAAPPSSTPVGRMRHLLVGGHLVAYQLRQAAGRRLAITIDESGVRVGAPPRLTLGEIEAFVRGHGEWVVRKLDEFASRPARRHLSIRNGMRLPVLGEDVEVRVVAGGNRVLWRGDALVIAARADADLEALARRGLQRKALDHFALRLGHYAARMGRDAPPLRLSSARTRWGSCSTKSGIRLNWRLVHLPPRCADYVVAHELAHLVEMNHGRRFWDVVAGLCPDWREARAELKHRAGEIPLL